MIFDDRIGLLWTVGGKEVILNRHFTRSVKGVTIDIPIRIIDGQRYGFVNDGGSVPVLFRGVVERFGLYLPDFLPHDYRWSFRYEFPDMNFSDTNDLLYHGCLETGKQFEAKYKLTRWMKEKRAETQAYGIYRAVQSFGKPIWNRGKIHVGDLSWHYAPI